MNVYQQRLYSSPPFLLLCLVSIRVIALIIDAACYEYAISMGTNPLRLSVLLMGELGKTFATPMGMIIEAHLLLLAMGLRDRKEFVRSVFPALVFAIAFNAFCDQVNLPRYFQGSGSLKGLVVISNLPFRFGYETISLCGSFFAAVVISKSVHRNHPDFEPLRRLSRSLAGLCVAIASCGLVFAAYASLARFNYNLNSIGSWPNPLVIRMELDRSLLQGVLAGLLVCVSQTCVSQRKEMLEEGSKGGIATWAGSRQFILWVVMNGVAILTYTWDQLDISLLWLWRAYEDAFFGIPWLSPIVYANLIFFAHLAISYRLGRDAKTELSAMEENCETSPTNA